MRRKALGLARPAAAHTIVQTLLDDDLPLLQLNAEKRGQMAIRRPATYTPRFGLYSIEFDAGLERCVRGSHRRPAL